MRNRLTVAVAAILSLGLCSQASAQATCTTAGCNVTDKLTVTVPTLQTLTISATTTPLTAPAITDLGGAAIPAGTGDAGPNVTAKANVPFSVTIAAAAANYSFVNTGTNAFADPGKPSANTAWSLASNGTYAALSTTAASLATSATPGSQAFSVFYRTSWNITDVPGSYSLNVTYTLTEP